MSALRTSAAVMAVVFAGPAHAGVTTDPSPSPAPPAASGLLLGKLADGSAWDQALSVPVLYKNPDNRWIEEIALIGQLQTQYAYGSNDSGNFGSGDMPDDLTWGDVEVRRFRLGAKGRLFEKLTFLNLMDLYPDLDPRVYKRTPETYLTYEFSEACNLSAGKTELKFNREQEYSSKEFLPFERTALGNIFYGGELTGAWLCGKNIAGGWLYYLGAYSNDRVDEFTRFQGGAMLLGKIGYNYTKQTSWDLAEVKFQWLHNTDPGFAESTSCLASPLYANSFSFSNQITEGPFGLTVEALWGDGVDGRPDVGGIMAMPTYSFTEKLQLITTIEAARSSNDNGIYLPLRYEALAPDLGDKAGDTYFATYAGLNYYIHSHNLKLMSGVKYSYLDGATGGGDFNGWTFLAGVRIAF
jgi:phosphate-selective porin OprO/OprP